MKNWMGLMLLVLTTMGLQGREVSLLDLDQYADALNIEGGLVAQRYLGPSQVWANLAFVLDRPFANGVDWDELTKANAYPLKEASLPDYNERQVLWIQASVLAYYLRHARELALSRGKGQADMVVQVHRGTSGPRHIQVLDRVVREMMPELGRQEILQTGTTPSYYFPDQHCRLSFRFGYDEESLIQDSSVDVVLSISLVAGLHPQWASGTCCVPATFVPLDLHSLMVGQGAAFASKNHLLRVMDRVIAEQNGVLRHRINRQFRSSNPSKKHLVAEPLTRADFLPARVFQANGVFCPKQLPASFQLL